MGTQRFDFAFSLHFLIEHWDDTHGRDTCNVPRNQPDHVTNPIKFSVITTT
jgi:hypothetical protein